MSGGATFRQILEQFKTGYGELDVGLSVVTIVELTTASSAPERKNAGSAARRSWTN